MVSQEVFHLRPGTDEQVGPFVVRWARIADALVGFEFMGEPFTEVGGISYGTHIFTGHPQLPVHFPLTVHMPSEFVADGFENIELHGPIDMQKKEKMAAGG